MTKDEDLRLLRPKYIVAKLPEAENKTVCEVTCCEKDSNIPIQIDSMAATDPSNVDSPFVLMPRKDPAAFLAMLTYMQHCEPDLAEEIHEWLNRMTEAGPEYGTQGTRNWITVRERIIRLATPSRLKP